MTKILIDMPVDAPALARLDRSALCLEFVEPAEESRTLPAGLIHDAEILFCTFPPRNLECMQRLEWIQVSSTGYSQLAGLGLSGKGVRVTNARGCFDAPIAEWNLAMMVNLARNLPRMLRNQQAGIWDRSAEFQREIRGLTAGIWGYGGIGRETARLARSLGLRVHVLSRHGVGPAGEVYCLPGCGDPQGALPDRVFAGGEEHAFLAGLDFLILALPLTKTSEGIVGEAELRALPRHAFVLNPARGPLIVETALVRALKEGWIAGAALDTHYAYPLPPGHPLWSLPNVILTPHISGSSASPHYHQRVWDIFVQNVARFQDRRPMLNELTADTLLQLG